MIYLCVLILFSCGVKKDDTASTQDISTQDFTGEFIDKVSDISKRTETERFELEYPGGINPLDIPHMGIKYLRSIKQLLAALPDEQVKEIGAINLQRENITSFNGIEMFTGLTSFGMRGVFIKNFEDLILPNRTWLFLDESEIESLIGFDNFYNIKNLVSLSLDGAHIKDKDSLELIKNLNSLEAISLERFPDYKKVLNILPESIEVISLQLNGINSIKEIEFLKEKYPHLREVYVMGNNFTEEDVYSERPNWFPVELCWWDDS
jgi:hypothetical protein